MVVFKNASSRPKTKRMLLFLLGCFSMTQVNIIGYIGISELVMYFVAPFVFIRNHKLLRQHGFMPVLILAGAWMTSALISDVINGSPIELLLRGVATPYAVLATIVCLHALLYHDIEAIKWLLFGVACSSIISIFVFQPGSAVANPSGVEAMEAVLTYKLFWVLRATLWFSLIIQVAYLRLPQGVSLGIVGFLMLFSLFQGGRSAFLCSSISFLIILLGGRRVQGMKRIKQHFGVFVIVGVLSIVVIKGMYRFAVTTGMMGEEELTKYEAQTEGGGGLLGLLMTGRADFFVGIMAIMDKPLLGHGSWAIDSRGYQLDFLTKYGNEDDYERYLARHRKLDRTIPGHSHVVGFWLWHGLAGGFFWMYVLAVIVKTIKNNMAVVPELYGYLALAIPSAVWNIMFSPFGMRTSMCCLIAVCLAVQAIKQGRLQYLPNKGLKHGFRGAGLPAVGLKQGMSPSSPFKLWF